MCKIQSCRGQSSRANQILVVMLVQEWLPAVFAPVSPSFCARFTLSSAGRRSAAGSGPLQGCCARGARRPQLHHLLHSAGQPATGTIMQISRRPSDSLRPGRDELISPRLRPSAAGRGGGGGSSIGEGDVRPGRVKRAGTGREPLQSLHPGPLRILDPPAAHTLSHKTPTRLPGARPWPVARGPHLAARITQSAENAHQARGTHPLPASRGQVDPLRGRAGNPRSGSCGPAGATCQLPKSARAGCPRPESALPSATLPS